MNKKLLSKSVQNINFCLKEKKRIGILILFILLINSSSLIAQINNSGCLGGNFGIDAGLYSNQIEFGTASPAAGSNDWFFSSGTGLGVIDQSNPSAIQSILQAPGNPLYVRRMNTGISSLVNGQLHIDAVWARDNFGGTGGTDQTSFNTASKNGEDPATWDPGPQNVLGKNDLIDVGGYLFRNGTSLTDDLWFVGLINRAEPGGDAYMDFEFFVEDVSYNPSSGFASGGPQLGHTAYTFDPSGNITKVGDFLFNVMLTGGGVNPNIEVRLWVSRADYDAHLHPAGFSWGTEFDGAFTGSPYGYASIVPATPQICGNINQTGQIPLAPPWGTKNTKYNSWGTTYPEYSVMELGINMTHFGIDHASLLGSDVCYYPIHTFIVKTRSSNAFTAQLKDFAGPFSWGQAVITSEIIGNPLMACNNPVVTLTANPVRLDVTYLWSTVDGHIMGDPTLSSITADQPGTYVLHTVLATGCSTILDASVTVGYDPSHPLFNDLTATSNVACSGSNGSINLNVTGGTSPYTYLWSNGSTLEDPAGLSPGTYSVTVTDNTGCVKSLSNVLVGSRVPTVISFIPTEISCYGYSNGSINATVTGQTPFTYLWSTAATTEDIVGLNAATYTLTTTDADRCTQSASITLSQASLIALSLSKVDDTDPNLLVGNGSIDLSVSGGTASYTYDWSNNGLQNPDTDPQDLSNLVAGVYTVIVTDANGCTTNISTTIYEPEICSDGIDNDGNGLTDCYDPHCQPPTPGTIVASANPVCIGAMGVTYTVPNTVGYTYNWTVPAGASITSGSGSHQITVSWISNIAGQVCVNAENSSGCISTNQSCLTVIVKEVPPQPSSIIKTP